MVTEIIDKLFLELSQVTGAKTSEELRLDHNNKSLRADNKVLRERLDAVEDLAACYRLQRSPTEKLFKRLEKTKQALIEQALKAPE